MNFTYTEDQLAIKEVADRMFRDLGGDEQIKACYAEAVPFHKELWQQLAESGLLAVPLATQYGGSELGMTELCLVVEAQGRAVAPIPLIETAVECAMPIGQFANDELKQRILPGVSSGEMVLCSVRPYQGLRDRQPLTASVDGNTWVLNGHSSLVTYAPIANGFLVSAKTETGENWVGYCDAQIKGLSITGQKTTSNEAAGHLIFEGVQVSDANTIAVGDAADTLLEWKAQRTYAAIAAQQVGLLKEGLQRAAEYTNERKQFGRSLSSFQAVAQQAADAYMAIEALRGVYWRALDDIDAGRNAELSARVAKFWVCEAGHVAAHISLHIHGGIGQDLDYPAHRFFVWAKRNESYLGAADKHAVALGNLIKGNPEKVAL